MMSNKLYTIGRGKVFFDVFTSGTTVGTGERYLGNTPAFNLTTASENLDHFDADEGIKSKDKSVTLSLNRTGQITCDNIDPDNVALFFLAATATQVQAAATGKTSVFAVLHGDRWYQLGVTTGNPSGDRDVASVSIPGGTVTTDYTVDATLGRIYIVAGGALDGDLAITVTYNTLAKSRKTIISSSSASVDGALRFIAYNPTGTNLDYYMPSVKLAPNGDYELKGDAWQQMSFTVEIQERDADTEAIYVDGRPYTAT
jgi:hypothetical protein